jgi:hypothetical protein
MSISPESRFQGSFAATLMYPLAWLEAQGIRQWGAGVSRDLDPKKGSILRKQLGAFVQVTKIFVLVSFRFV